MAATSLNLKHLSRLLHPSSLLPMAAYSLNLKHLPRLLHTSSLRPMTLRATSGFLATDTEKMFYETFNVKLEPEPTSENPVSPYFVRHVVKARGREDGFDVCLFMAGVSKSENPSLPYFVHHVVKARGREDGFDICLYLAGVSKENVELRIERDEMIAEGKMVNYKNEIDKVLIRYRMSRPPIEVFNLDATKAEIMNGILKVHVPRKD